MKLQKLQKAIKHRYKNILNERLRRLSEVLTISNGKKTSKNG